MSTTQPSAEPRDLDFPVEEFQGRVARAQALMRKEGMAALLATHLDNVFYFTGYRSWLKVSQHRPIVTVLPAQGDPILILPTLEAGNANLKAWVQDVRLWQASDDYVALFVDVLREVGAAGDRVGIEMGDDMWMGMPIYQWDRLRAAQPGGSFASSAELMWELRSVKSAAEVEVIRRAAQIADQAVAAGWDALKPGVTERQIAAAIGAAMLADGADAPNFLAVKSGLGPHSAGNKYAADRVVQSGDIVMVDVGCFYRGYTSDMIRSASLGEPDPQHRLSHDRALAMNRACLAEVRAGVPIKKVDEARVRFLQRHNYPLPAYAGVGHNLGISVHELPRIGPEGDGVLQAGNVITVEPSIRVSPWGGIAVEDMVLVTESGYQELTRAPRELVIKG